MRWNRSDVFIALSLFLVVSSIYFATTSGITSSNDGSHYALVRALVDRRSFEIAPYLDFTEHQDYALRGEYRFSDRPPATALLTAPLYAIGNFSPAPIVPVPSKHDSGNMRLLYAVMAAPIFAAGSLTMFYIVLRQQLQRSHSASLLAATSLAFGTTTWKYGSVLYSHALAGLVLWIGVFLALQAQNDTPSKALSFAFGFTIGFAPLVEYTNVLVAAVLGIDWIMSLRKTNKGNWRPLLDHLGFAALGACMPIVFLLLYNTLNFGGPFEISTFHVDTTIWPQNAGLAADFATPLLQGLRGMLFFGDSNQGLFLLAPVAILSLFGLYPLWRHSRRAFLLVIGLFVIMLLTIAKSTTFNPLTNDGRYLTPFIGLWLVPLAFWLDDWSKKSQGELSVFATRMLFYGLLFLSVRNQFVHIAYSWNYDLNPTRLLLRAISPENISYILTTVFPNRGNLPVLWFTEILIGGLIWFIWQWWIYKQETYQVSKVS